MYILITRERGEITTAILSRISTSVQNRKALLYCHVSRVRFRISYFSISIFLCLSVYAASTSSMFATMNGGVLTVVTNGITVASQPGHVPTPGCLPNGDVNVVNNLYSTVDRSQKQPLTPQQPHNHIHRKVSEGKRKNMPFLAYES